MSGLFLYLIKFPPLGVGFVLDEVCDVEDVVNVVSVPAGQYARHGEAGPVLPPDQV